jgi:hypothetical protein
MPTDLGGVAKAKGAGVILQRILQNTIEINQEFKRDFNDYFCDVRQPNFARVLNHAPQSFEDRRSQNRSSIPLG